MCRSDERAETNINLINIQSDEPEYADRDLYSDC